MEASWQLACYIVRYHHDLLIEKERLACRHLLATAKSMQGRSDEAAQLEALKTKLHFRDLLSNEPEILELARGGSESFVMAVGRRLYAEHRDRLTLNFCPKCGGLARTPEAKQCRHCLHDWHEASAERPDRKW